MTGLPAGGQAVVTGRVELVPDVVELTLSPSVPVPRVPPGSHLDLRIPSSAGASVAGTRTRSYSLVDTGRDDGLLRVAVRLARAGRGGSRWVHGLRPGAEITFGGPVDDFAPSPGARPVLLLAAGIGVTPILGVARALQATGVDYTIVYTGRSRERMAYLDHLQEQHPGRFRMVETQRGTRLDPDEVVGALPDDGVLYVCGPLGLLTAARAAWQRAGRPLSTLRFETFGNSGEHPTTAFRVDVPARGVSVEVPARTTLLDALEDAGVEVLYDCLRGECGLCRVRILAADGDVDHRDVFLSERQRAEGRTLCACVSRLAGRSLTIDC